MRRAITAILCLLCGCSLVDRFRPEQRPVWAVGLVPAPYAQPGPRPAGPLDVDGNGNVEHWDYWRVWICRTPGRECDCSRADVTGDGKVDDRDLAKMPKPK